MKKRIQAVITTMIFGAVMCTAYQSELVDAAIESRSYLKYTFATGETTNYTLSLNENSRTILSDPDGKVGNFTGSVDTRLVKCAGTGFIVGAHTIATNAHCVYNRATDVFSTTQAYTAYTYDNEGNPTPHTLTPVSVHIPEEYDTASNYTSYDYAMVVVEEDLTEYGFFNLGLALDGIDTIQSNGEGIEVITAGFPQYDPPGDVGGGNMVDGHRVRPLQSVGNLYSLSDLRIYYTCDVLNGSSGSPVYVSTTYRNVQYDTVIGIVSHHSDSLTPANKGVRITQPILMFYLNNDFAEEESS